MLQRIVHLKESLNRPFSLEIDMNQFQTNEAKQNTPNRTKKIMQYDNKKFTPVFLR